MFLCLSRETFDSRSNISRNIRSVSWWPSITFTATFSPFLESVQQRTTDIPPCLAGSSSITTYRPASISGGFTGGYLFNPDKAEFSKHRLDTPAVSQKSPIRVESTPTSVIVGRGWTMDFENKYDIRWVGDLF